MWVYNTSWYGAELRLSGLSSLLMWVYNTYAVALHHTSCVCVIDLSSLSNELKTSLLTTQPAGSSSTIPAAYVL